MDRAAYSIIVILFFLLVSCGQVGTITGGPVDNEAPKPILSEVQPPQASLKVSPKRIQIPFNEYISLNKPNENIRVMPKDVTLDHSISGKTLVLDLKEGAWKENTTYSIYLNRAIQDITEENDSIMFYVFSTGPMIDSLKASVKVVDAFNKEEESDITVGLFEAVLVNDTTEHQPRYFSTTNEKGIARFKYLKEGLYYVYAFNDENRNNQLDPSEDRAKMNETLTPLAKDTIIDTLRLMPPVINEIRVVTNEFTSPGVWSIGFNKPVPKNYSLIFEGSNPIDSAWSEQKDSVTFYLKNQLSGNETFILRGPKSADTISKRFFFKERPMLKADDNLKNGKLIFGDTLLLSWNDGIESIDTSRIVSSYMEDSVEINFLPEFEIIKPNGIRVTGLNRNAKSSLIRFLPKAVTGNNLKLEDTLNLKLLVGKEKDLGSLIVKTDTLVPNGVLVLLNLRGDEVRRKRLENETKTTFKNLTPGKYTYYILMDENKNGYWDTGSIFSEVEAEKVLWFNQSSTIRANWEVESNLNVKAKLK
jgi:uncharacterized protein (DUF2141 family)